MYTSSSRPFWSHARNALFIFGMLAILLITLTALASLADPGLAFTIPRTQKTQKIESGTHKDISDKASKGSASVLADFALQKVLKEASPIWGTTAVVYASESSTAIWMSMYPDDTLLVHMNIPGTHDAATWNYSKRTQDSLEYINALGNITASQPSFYRCQSNSLATMLDAGIRVFDLRYALDIARTSLVFWHGDALQSETATVDDVLFSLYNWLEWHASEAVFLSFQHEGGNDDAVTQAMLYATLTSPAAKQYIKQTRGELGTLGEARGKITLLRRFDLNELSPSYEESIPGVHFSPTQWSDNGPDIELVYNATTNATAYIEDYYQPLTPNNSTAATNIRWKVNATEAHLRRAASNDNPDSLFWSFASSTNTGNDPPITPVIQALGNGSHATPKGGVNDHLMRFLQEMRGHRLGIVMFDFYDEPEELIPTFLDLINPNEGQNKTANNTKLSQWPDPV